MSRMISYIPLILILMVMASLGYTPFVVVTMSGVKYRNKKYINSNQLYVYCPVWRSSVRLLWEPSEAVFVNHIVMWHQGGQIYLINRGSMSRPCAVQAGEDKARLSHSLHCYCPYKISWYKEARPKKAHYITMEAKRRLYRLFNSAVGLC